MTHWGAAPEDWAHFDLNLGLTEDILPVVSDPTAEISDRSNMKALGKTPSHFNGQGKAVGIPDWTSRIAKPAEVDRWMNDGRLGICVQTRRVRALDIDVDHPSANAIADLFALIAFDAFPRRFRANSGKQLLAFMLGGEYPKRSFKTAHGLVEFLGNGQQMVVSGTHPSGERYQWENGLPESLPLLTAEQFEKAWAAIVERFALPDTAYEAGTRRRGEDFHAVDPVAEHLVEQSLVLAEGRDGQLFVECPWKDGHSSDSGITESAWFPAGSNGYDQGHFKCLHASCDKRSDDDFMEALGIGTSSDFEALPAVVEDTHTPPARPNFVNVNVKTGEIPALLHNVMLALENPRWFGYRIAYDNFLGEEVIGYDDGPGWRPLRDADSAIMRRRFDQLGFKPVGPELMRSAISGICERQRIDSAIEWLGVLKWDGVPRVETFLSTVFGALDTPYTRAVALYWWTAQAGRVLAAPCQVDMVPILLSDEGHYKTTTLQALVPSLANYTKIDLAHRDPDLSRKMRGALLGEIEEMRGLQGRGGEGTKGFVTTQVEEWTPKYQEKKTYYPRRLLLVGTTNDEDLLDGESGRRRWLPVRVNNARRDLAAEMREQLWAEGAQLFRKQGVMWSGAHELGREEIKNYIVEDMWHAAIAKWVASTAGENDDTYVSNELFTTTERVARAALMLDAKNHNRAVSNRICNILRLMGFKPGFHREEGVIIRGWRHADTRRICEGVGSVSQLSP